MAKEVILVVEDHQDISDILKAQLSESYTVERVYDGEAALRYITEHPQPNLMLLDIMLPKINGLDVCKRVRAQAKYKNMGIIMLSAKSDEASVVKALELGADDYVFKPFRSAELHARIKNVLKRQIQTANTAPHTLMFQTLQLNKDLREVKIDQQPVHLTKTEFEMLWCFVSKPDRVYTRDQLLDAVKGDQVDVFDRNIDVHVFSLRKKIKPYDQYIKTIRSVGYRFMTELVR